MSKKSCRGKLGIWGFTTHNAKCNPSQNGQITHHQVLRFTKLCNSSVYGVPVLLYEIDLMRCAYVRVVPMPKVVGLLVIETVRLAIRQETDK